MEEERREDAGSRAEAPFEVLVGRGGAEGVIEGKEEPAHDQDGQQVADLELQPQQSVAESLAGTAQKGCGGERGGQNGCPDQGPRERTPGEKEFPGGRLSSRRESAEAEYGPGVEGDDEYVERRKQHALS